MKHPFAIGLVAAAVLLAGCREEAEQPKLDLSTLESKVSYGIGLSVGNNAKSAGFAINEESFKAGFSDALGGRTPQLTEEESQQAFEEFRTQQETKAKAEQEAQAAQQLEKSTAFLDEYAQRDGVTKTASGLMYKVVTAGSGAKPKAEDTVTVHYKGTLVDGTQFDSSYERNQPAVFPVNAVIPGWVEALQLMPVGSKWELVMPAELAYGAEGAAPVIPPNAALVFEVELIGIGAAQVPAAEAPAAQ